MLMKVKRMHKLLIILLMIKSCCCEKKVWYGDRDGDRCTNVINDEEKDSILCESCLIWFHFRCKGLKPKLQTGFVITLTDI